GRVRARSENGPISLRECSRTIEATTQNGPISLSGGSGDSRLTAENGPISVELGGDRWQGAGLVASTENGPLELKLPGRYHSGIRVEMRGASATNVSCTAPECAKASWTWSTHTHQIRFGDDPPTVKLSTENGPVSIQSRSIEL